MANTGSAGFERVQVASTAELRDWLRAHHGRTESVWLVTFKKGRGPWVAYGAVVDTLLCFGWIDSRPAKLDADRTMLLISPRRRGSAWSAVNREKVARLEAEGRIEAPGRAAIAAARADGSWDALAAIDALEEPDDLAGALDATPGARPMWAACPPSSRRAILEWILAAKRPETRRARVAETARLAALGRKANFPPGRDAIKPRG
jgi:uncharacterized protein YdeI (YjbR/CyaY-like superfamily)